MKLNRSTSYICNVASKSHTYIIIASFNLYKQRWLILAYPKIVCPRSNMSLRLNNSIGTSKNASNLTNKTCPSKKSINWLLFILSPQLFLSRFFPPSKPGAGLSKTKGPGQLVLGTSVDYKKICCLHLGKYFQVNQ